MSCLGSLLTHLCGDLAAGVVAPAFSSGSCVHYGITATSALRLILI